MMRALEEHLAVWMKGQVSGLAAQCGLFGPVETQAGELDWPASAPFSADAVAIAVRAERIIPEPENRDLGPPPVTAGATLHVAAQLTVRLLGDTGVLGDAPDRLLRPAGAHLHRVDLVTLTLLSLLREQPGPGPDIAEPPELDEHQGERPAGAASALAGSRQAHLYWTALQPGEAVLTPEIRVGEARRLRCWEIPLRAVCTYVLSPAAQEGGRILAIDRRLTARDRRERHGDGMLYAPAESIPLDHFAGLGVAVLTELGGQELATLGDLGRLGSAGVARVASDLRTATPEERSRLGELAEIASLRYGPLVDVPLYELDPQVMALPARALLSPAEAEAALLLRLSRTPEIAGQLAVLATPTAFALTPPRRETVKVGNLLLRR